MIAVNFEPQYESWRDKAKEALSKNIPPEQLIWFDKEHKFPGLDSTPERKPITLHHLLVPREFVELAEIVSRHESPKRWELLYRVLWRIAHGQRHLLEIEIDEDVKALLKMRKEVVREAYRKKTRKRNRRTAVQSLPPGQMVLPLMKDGSERVHGMLEKKARSAARPSQSSRVSAKVGSF